MAKWYVKDGVWQSCVCDKVVCRRWCVTKLCVCACDKVVCERLCVANLCVCDRLSETKLCVKELCVTKLYVTKLYDT